MSAGGRVWKFGDDVNTDLIIPGRYLDSYDPDHLAAHAMEGARKDFASSVKKGDIIVAGSNFGCGSSREQAVVALKHSGVVAVVAKSFARIFYRNAVNLGLTVLVSGDAHDKLADGDRVVIDLGTGDIVAADSGRRASADPIPEHLKKILESGGLVPYIKSRLNR